MTKYMKRGYFFRNGFTLVEILIVIAIIGMLSSVVLVALNQSRRKAEDTKTKSQLSSLRTVAEQYRIELGTYGASVNLCTTGMFSDVPSSMYRFTNVNNYPVGTTMTCNTDGVTYAVQASLSNPGEYWCVDSQGVSKFATTTLGNAALCP